MRPQMQLDLFFFKITFICIISCIQDLKNECFCRANTNITKIIIKAKPISIATKKLTETQKDMATSNHLHSSPYHLQPHRHQLRPPNSYISADTNCGNQISPDVTRSSPPPPKHDILL